MTVVIEASQVQMPPASIDLKLSYLLFIVFMSMQPQHICCSIE